MKKILVAAAIMMSMISCNKDQTISLNQEAIGFDNAFINNSTKSVEDPSYDNTNLFSDFAVYGFVEGNVLFDGVKVKGSELNGDWTYTGTQYWIAGAKYNFAAVAPMTDGNWTKTSADKYSTTISFTNNGTTDLLYAQTADIEGKVTGNEKVGFTFRHILSKVKFSFENAYNASNATIKVSNIKITDAFKTGQVTLSTSETTWSNQAQASANDFELDFGAAVNEVADDNINTDGTQVSNTADAYTCGTTLESYNELFLIPSTGREYTITFHIDLLISGTAVNGGYNHTAKVSFAPTAGNSYNIKAVINTENIDPDHSQEPIQFTVTNINGWTDANPNPEVTIPSINN